MINESKIIGVKGKRIAFLGNISHKKGPQLLLHAFHAVHECDSEFTLHLGGAMQDPRYAITYDWAIPNMGLRDAIEYYGFIESPLQWLPHFDYILVSSPWEGSPVGVLEALSCGLHPLISNFVGATYQYPPEYIWTTIPQLIERIKAGRMDPDEIKQFVKDNYSLEKQFAAIDQIVADTLREPKKVIPQPKQKSVSAIMAVKNGEKTIDRALNSLIKQRRALQKIVVVDDGSTDQTVEKVRALQKTTKIPIEVISLSPSHWVFAARNEGIKYIASDYFFFLDTDDMVEPSYTEELCAVLDANPQIDVVYPDMLYFNDKGGSQALSVPDFDSQVLTSRNYIAYAAMQRTEKFGMLNGYNIYLNDSRNHLAEWDLWLRCVQQQFSFYHLPKPLFHYYKESNSTQMSENYVIPRHSMHLQMAWELMRGLQNIQMNQDKERIVLVCQGKDYMDRSKVGFEVYTWARPLEMNGQYEVYVFQYDVEIQHWGVERTQQRFMDYIRAIQPKYVFHPSYRNDISVSTWSEISNDFTTIVWNSDNHRYDSFCKEYDKGFRYAVTTYPEIFDRMGHSGRILSQWAANKAYFWPATEKTINVSFCGQVYGDRKQTLSTLEVACYGYGWPNGFVEFAQMAKILRDSRISINFSRGGDGGQQIKLRPFEICASDTLCLCEAVPGIEKYYTPGEEIVLFDSKEELRERIDYYLVHEEERARIAHNAYERTVKKHLWEHRFEKIFGEINNA